MGKSVKCKASLFYFVGKDSWKRHPLRRRMVMSADTGPATPVVWCSDSRCHGKLVVGSKTGLLDVQGEELPLFHRWPVSTSKLLNQVFSLCRKWTLTHFDGCCWCVVWWEFSHVLQTSSLFMQRRLGEYLTCNTWLLGMLRSVIWSVIPPLSPLTDHIIIIPCTVYLSGELHSAQVSTNYLSFFLPWHEPHGKLLSWHYEPTKQT